MNSDGKVAAHPRIVGFVGFTLSTRANEHEDLARTQSRVGCQGIDFQ
jgi:hypothetical protein